MLRMAFAAALALSALAGLAQAYTTPQDLEAYAYFIQAMLKRAERLGGRVSTHEDCSFSLCPFLREILGPELI